MPYNFGFADAVHGSLAQQRQVEIISNNLANVSTPGYKADRMLFNDLMGRRVFSDLEQGPMEVTDQPLDFGIRGEGFFQVRTKNGIRLTRAGAFKMDSEGALRTPAGDLVLGAGNAPINLNPNGGRPDVDEEGGIHQNGEVVGQIGVVEVVDKNNLEKEGLNLFSAKGGKAPATRPAQDYSLLQGALEQSNATVVSEMVGMINSFRGFESYQKAIQVMQEIDQKAATQLGRVG
jgi:flagellar basal-body rod protein FlgF